MCGRYFRRSDKKAIASRFKVMADINDFVLPPFDYNIAPTTHQAVIRNSRETGEREMKLMRWGLIPFFAESLAAFKGISTINARAEDIMRSQTWQGPMKSRRCIVPIDGFYEWKAMNDHKKPAKQPYAIGLKSGEPFALAGVWDAWKEPKKISPQDPDHWLQSFSIITTEANELMAPIHIRMPVILHPRDYDRWLSREASDQPPVDLLRPYDSEEMQAVPANSKVGNVRNNGPEMLNSA